MYLVDIYAFLEAAAAQIHALAQLQDAVLALQAALRARQTHAVQVRRQLQDAHLPHLAPRFKVLGLGLQDAVLALQAVLRARQPHAVQVRRQLQDANLPHLAQRFRV